MLFILISWLYVCAISIIFGITINRVFGINHLHSAISICVGFFGVSLLTGFYAIWFPIDGYFQILLISISFVLLIINKSFISNYVSLLKSEYRSLSRFLKLLLGFIFILILAQSASPPFIIDNESYYIQTIKWLNNFGYVKGLVNLHLFLGQTSGWHILQSAFNFSFIYDRFNDISGLILILGNYYALTQLNSYIYKKDKSKISLAVGLFPVFNVFFIQFISAPSPDIAIYVLVLMVCHLFIVCYNYYSKDTFILLTLLVLFMIFIKLTVLLYCLLPIVVFIKHYTYSRKNVISLAVITSITVFSICIKNIIITGSPIFPIMAFSEFQASWHLPQAIQTYFNNYGLAGGYQMSLDSFEQSTWFVRLKSWVLALGIHGLFNKALIIILTFTPFILKHFYHNKAYWWFYFVGLLSVMALFLTSPQYRFYFPFILVFSLLILGLIVIHKKTIQIVLIGATVLVFIPLVFLVNIQKLTNNENHVNSNPFKLTYLIEPHRNSRFANDYKTIQMGNTYINTPNNIDFFWGTGDVPVPAVNQEQLDYFKTYFRVIPQQYSEDLKDGFYCKTIKDE
jgi:hypothetical protein